jgi:hypothetical protein
MKFVFDIPSMIKFRYRQERKMFNLRTSFILALAVVMGNALFSEAAPISKQAFCEQHSDWAAIRKLAELPENRLSFANPSGLLDTGLCWWHSLLQRSALYLGAFRPELPKPKPSEARRIINALMKQNHVVEIPGYRNIFDFSKAFERQISLALSERQIVDGVVLQKWIQNVRENPWTSPDVMLSKVTELEKEANVYRRIPWVMMKLPGVMAHSVLILSVERKETGYGLKYIDSNFPGTTETAWYNIGDQSIKTNYGNITLTVGYKDMFSFAESAIQSYCEQADKN